MERSEERPALSVIIPTYRDWPRAALTVQALLEQDYSPENFEILLVNNAPDDPPPASFPHSPLLRILEEPAPGSYAARNTGAHAARGQILVFTDSDCIPKTDFLRNLCPPGAPLREMHFVSGQVQMFSPEHEMSELNTAEAYDYFFGINQSIYAREGVAATANLSVARNVFDQIGGFNADLLSGGDVDFCRRARGTGAILRYCDSAIVRHPLRTDLPALIAKARRVAGGRAQKDGWKALAITLAPPIVRLRILFTKKTPGGRARWRAGWMIFYVKAVEIHETISIIAFRSSARR